eukprot:1157296-Pelagomonas_calceolata.AAC.2
MPYMGDILPDTLKPTSEYEGLAPPKQPPASSQQVATSALKAHPGVHLQAWGCSRRVRADRRLVWLAERTNMQRWAGWQKAGHHTGMWRLTFGWGT